MRASIEPVSAVPSNLLKDHLLRYGLPPAIIEWKYFDPVWTPPGERGYVWTRDGRVQGMIGLIPFRIRGPAGVATAAWTCDWFVESSAKNPGIGVLVFKEAIAKAGLLFTLGGNEATARMVPRLATHSVPEAAVEMTLPLAVGGTVTYGRIERRAPVIAHLGLDRLPLRRPGRGRSRAEIRLERGIASEVAALIEEGGASGWSPAYEPAQLAWQFERCPAIEAASGFVRAGHEVVAAVICWRAQGARRQWRLAIWLRPGHEAAATGLLGAVLDEIERRGGQAVSSMVSSSDEAVRRLLDAAGFTPTERVLPLYALANGSMPPITVVDRISHADSDLGYRFN